MNLSDQTFCEFLALCRTYFPLPQNETAIVKDWCGGVSCDPSLGKLIQKLARGPKSAALTSLLCMGYITQNNLTNKNSLHILPLQNRRTNPIPIPILLVILPQVPLDRHLKTPPPRQPVITIHPTLLFPQIRQQQQTSFSQSIEWRLTLTPSRIKRAFPILQPFSPRPNIATPIIGPSPLSFISISVDPSQRPVPRHFPAFHIPIVLIPISPQIPNVPLGSPANPRPFENIAVGESLAAEPVLEIQSPPSVVFGEIWSSKSARAMNVAAREFAFVKRA
ncbi:translation initiation factor IF-2 [Striga asiatica]|uniref:Translation initiation factor IF-2 n=1 Tax=Striga asiatica TaxID=4170 RepID=A0A5A7PWE4_STRAF|nr:translation initiation factor IF-2 [Striga asiatica]